MPGLYGNGAGNVTVPAGSTSSLYQLSQDINVLQASDYGNANVAAYLASGNLTSNIITTGNVAGSYILGDGSQLTNLPTQPGTYGNANVATFMANFGSNSISTTGNITGGYIFGNGSQLTGLPATYGNANVNAHLAAFGSNVITTTGNVTAGYFIGDGSQLTNLPASSYGNANVAAFLPTYTGNLAGGNLAVTNNGTIGGNLTVSGTIYGTFAGNISGNLVVPGSNTEVIYNNNGNAGASSDFTFNDTFNQLTVNGTVISNNTGAASGDFAIVQLGGHTGNINIGYGVGSGNTNLLQDVYQTGGNLSTVGSISATGNITGNYVFGNAAFMTGIPASYGNANVANFLANYGSNTIVTTGNITGGNLLGTIRTATQTSITRVGTLTTLGVSGNASVDGRVETGTEVRLLDAPGGGDWVSIKAPSSGLTTWTLTLPDTDGTSGQFLQTNGVGVTTWATPTSSYGNANVTTLLAAFGSNTIATTGNITSGNIIANGQYLTNLPGANVTGTVANATYATSAGSASTATHATTANTVTDAAQANITSVGTLTGLTVGGDSNITGNLIVGQDLTVNGNTIYTNITELNVQDPIISQGRGANNTPLTNNDGKDRGEQFWYYTDAEKSAFSGYDNSAGKMLLATDVSIANEIVTVNSLGNIVGGNIEATTVVTSGNVTASYVIGNGSLLSSLTGANVTGTVANATYAVSAGSATTATTAGTVTTAAQPNITSVGTLSTLTVSGNIGTGGILTDGYYYANGTPVTFGGGSTYGNANVSAYLASGTNTANIVTTGNITGGNLTTTGGGGDITGANTVYANNVAANSVTSAGRIVAGAVTYANADGSAGQVLTTYGNGITYFSTAAASYGNSNVVTLLAGFGSNTISTTGNITGGYILGNGSQLTGISASPGGTPYQFQYNNSGVFGGVPNTNYYSGNGTIELALSKFEATGSSGIITVPGTAGYVSVTGNVIAGNVNTTGLVSAATLTTTGNIDIGGNLNMNGRMYDTSGVFQLNAVGNIVLVPTGTTVIEGNAQINSGSFTVGAVTYANTDGTAGQVLTTYGNGVTYFSTVSGGSGSPGGANTQIQFNDAGAFAGNALMTFDKVTGNITLGNIVVQPNQQLETVSAFSGNSSVRNPGQITVGDGYGGNITNTTYLTATARGSRLLSYDQYVKVDNGQRNAQMASLSYADLNAGNIGTANANSRIVGISSELYVINGNSVSTNPNPVRAQQNLLFAGTSANTGNANISGATVNYGYAQVNAGSRIGNAWINVADSANNGNATQSPMDTYIGYGIRPNHTANTTSGNVFGVYLPGTATTYGLNTPNVARAAGNYYFLRNDDDVAQNKLGSIRSYTDFIYTPTISSGALTIDKTNAQVQYVDVTENITSITLSNFVVLASNSVTSKPQLDTVTVVLRQDSTGRTVTLPTGSAYKYAGGGNVVSSTANSVTMLSISAIYNVSAAATEYLITVSPEFV